MLIAIMGPCSVDLLAHELPVEATGLETHSFPLISQIALQYIAAGHQVAMITTSTSIKDVRRYEGERLSLHVVPRRGSQKRLASDAMHRERKHLLHALRRVKPDVVHSHWLYEYSAAAIKYDANSLITAHDGPLAVAKNYPGLYWKVRSLLGFYVLNRARRVTAVSPELANELQRLRRKKTDIKVVANGIEMPARRDSQQPDRRASITFGVIANGFDQRKNTAVAISAFQKLRVHDLNCRLLLLGFGHGQNQEAEAWAQEAGLSLDGIEFRGPVNHSQIIYSLTNEIDVLVHTSRWEACSMAILEALSYGIPVIGGHDSGGVPFTLGYGSAGLMTDVRSADEVANSMLILATNPKRRLEFSRSGRMLAETQFSLQLVSQAYLALLSSRDVQSESIGPGGTKPLEGH